MFGLKNLIMNIHEWIHDLDPTAKAITLSLSVVSVLAASLLISATMMISILCWLSSILMYFLAYIVFEDRNKQLFEAEIVVGVVLLVIAGSIFVGLPFLWL